MQRQIAGPALRKALTEADVYSSHRKFWDDASGDIVDRMFYTDTKTNLVELLMKQDQMSMAASIESRVPFLDHHVVEFAAKVPPRYKLRTASGKRLVKKALAAYLPPDIIHRPKKGFPVPFDSWLNHEFSTEIRETQQIVDPLPLRDGSVLLERELRQVAQAHLAPDRGAEVRVRGAQGRPRPARAFASP